MSLTQNKWQNLRVTNIETFIQIQSQSILLPLQEEFLRSLSMSLRSTRLSSTAKTCGCSKFSIKEEDEEEPDSIAS